MNLRTLTNLVAGTVIALLVTACNSGSSSGPNPPNNPVSIAFATQPVQQAVDQQLQAKGWKMVATGGSVTVFATDNIHDQQEVQTMYDNMGGGWGGGWGWRGWGWGAGWGGPGFGSGLTTTTTTDQNIGNLVIDLFEGSSKKLLWRGLATENLSSNEDKNTKMVDGDIKSMFKNFPPKPSK
jgi:hypothetical protein